jgi:FkbM family methyltransferase
LEADWQDQDFSQHGEQPHILRYFLEHRDAPRYLVDIGAFDGITGSNSRSLLLRGWSGALVEPDPRTFARLAILYAERPDVVCVRCAIAGQAGVQEMHFTTGPERVNPALAWQYAQVNTLVSNIADGMVENHGYRFMPHLVSVATLHGLLDWVHAPAEIGFLSIDAEGVDTEIIRSADFRRHRPWLISVECDDRTRPEMIEALQPSNYSVYAITFSNTLFERKAQP